MLATAAAESIDFEKQILPVLEHKCFDCHSSRAKSIKGDVRLDQAAAIRALSKAKTDEMLRRTALPASDEDVMPPAKEHSPLSKIQREMLTDWIVQGRSTGTWTAFDHAKKVTKLAVASTEAASVIAAAAKIDQLLENKLRTANPPPVVPAPLADDLWLRRVSMDLIGRGPTATEAAAFLNSKHPDKRAKLIDSLLATEGHVSSAFNYWADALRLRTVNDNGRGAFTTKNDPFSNWLRDALRGNKRYDALVREMLTSEGTEVSAPAIGFYLRDTGNPNACTENQAALFLGEQISCAACHDHPYDQWTRKDYYSFAAYTTGISDRKLSGKMKKGKAGASGYRYLSEQDAKTIEQVKAPFNRYWDLSRSGKLDSVPMEEIFKPLEVLPAGLRERMMKTVSLDRVRNWTTMISSARGLVGDNKVFLPTDQFVYRLPRDYQYADAKGGDTVTPAVLFGTSPAYEKPSQLPFVYAYWLTSPQNPRFALVLSNRLWKKTFGWPLCGPVADVVDAAKSPCPELTSYVEALVIACGYDLRQIQRILLSTRAYARGAIAEETADHLPRLFAAPLLRRLTGEQVWDSLVALVDDTVDEKLTSEAADTSFQSAVYNAKSIEDFFNYMLDRWVKFDGKPPRSAGIYEGMDDIKSKLGEINPAGLIRASEMSSPAPDGHFLGQFGQSNRLAIGNAWTLPTLPQALTLINGPIFEHLTKSDSSFSRALAAQSSAEAKKRHVFQLLIGRQPSAKEQTLIATHTPEQIAWSLINSKQFLFLR